MSENSWKSSFTVAHVSSSPIRRVFALLLAILVIAPVSPAQAKPSSQSIKGAYGQVLTVSKVTGIKSGERLTVSGNRFDETIGIYVAFCVTPKKGKMPSPCGGGADESGTLGASKWISSNPPPYGDGLAIPFRPGGRFSVAIKVAPKIGSVDCRKVSCSVVVRADHTRSDDRSQDLFIPLTFKK